MRKFMNASAALFVFLCLTASSAFAKVRIFACEPEWQAIAEEIGGDKVKAYSATTAFQDPHFIEARPSLIAKTRRADMVFCTGAELEIGWLPLLIRQSGNTKIQESQPGYFMATSFVELIEIPKELDRSHGDVHAAGNPHAFWDPNRLLLIAKAFTKQLSLIDTEHADYYQRRLGAFEKKWQQAIQQWENQAAPLRNKKAIVYHKNWSYLLKWLGIELVDDLEPKPGLPPTSTHLAHLLKTSREIKPDFILMTNFQDDKGAKWLGEKIGVPIIRLPFTVGGSKQASNLIELYTEALSMLNDAS